ncbi:MAG: DUF3726 domain-containing protein [Alphaproteobacteria bacterium]|nr:DUF3726 domain-containing protein [Alphaproteobacteria bacterium]
MTFTLNEFETMGMKAARGAGLDWGIAEEAGKAVRWLAERNLPGAELLAELLTRNDGKCYDDLAPVSIEGIWTAKSGCLCPLIVGVTLADRAETLAPSRGLEIGEVAFPLLIAPYAAISAKVLRAPIELRWSGVTLTVASSDGFAIEGSDRDVFVSTAGSAQCRVLENSKVASSVVASVRRAIDMDIWNRLSAFAHRTYAPATKTSRELGAGSDLIDD